MILLVDRRHTERNKQAAREDKLATEFIAAKKKKAKSGAPQAAQVDICYKTNKETNAHFAFNNKPNIVV